MVLRTKEGCQGEYIEYIDWFMVVAKMGTTYYQGMIEQLRIRVLMVESMTVKHG